jgi:hypothetical protein
MKRARLQLARLSERWAVSQNDELIAMYFSRQQAMLRIEKTRQALKKRGFEVELVLEPLNVPGRDA